MGRWQKLSLRRQPLALILSLWFLSWASAAFAITPPTLGVGTTTPEATLQAHGPQAGSNTSAPEPVLGLTSEPDQGNGPKLLVYQGSDQYTTGATYVSNRWLGGIAATGNRSYAVDARIVARCTGGSGSCAGATGQTHYRQLVATYRSYNGGANCGIWGSVQTVAQPSTITSFSINLAQNPSGAPCEFGVIAGFPPNTTIQVDYILEVLELIDN